MQSEDIIMALKEMKVLDSVRKADADMVVNKAKVKQWLELNRAHATEPVDPQAFVKREDDDDDEDGDGER